MPAFATPNEEVIENQAKYDELTAKIDEITGQVYALDAEIEPLMETIENNKAEVEEIKIEVENTEKEIETTKADIEKSEEVLGKRIREFYKSGGQVNYLTQHQRISLACGEHWNRHRRKEPFPTLEQSGCRLVQDV